MTQQNKTPINGTAVLNHVKEIIGSKLSIKGLEEAGRWLAEQAEQLLPGQDGAAKKLWAKTHLVAVVETYDNLIPVIGAYMDLPFVDGLEKSAVDVAVEKGYAWLISRTPGAPVINAPEQSPGGLE